MNDLSIAIFWSSLSIIVLVLILVTGTRTFHTLFLVMLFGGIGFYKFRELWVKKKFVELEKETEE